jgi:hypothetical protein
MKTPRVMMIVTLSFLMGGLTTLNAQSDRVEVPGDHFSLEGALELFKKSASPEEFERMLNSADAQVNNLDLNGDGDIDYIRVIDRNEGNVHAFIIQAIISERESQDVAVISLEKLANGKAVLQITGDADIYGIETIIEPTQEVRINAGASTARTVVNVWAWPSVQYVYSPYYYGWVSPWRWSYWPGWWRPWRPVGYYAYYSRWEPYYPYYSVCHTHRVAYAQQIYRPYRNTSVIVYNRHYTQINNYRSSGNGSGYSRGRDNDGRNNNSTYNRDTNERQRSSVSQNGNSRSSATEWSKYNNDNNRSRTSATGDESSSGNRSAGDINKAPSSWERNSNSTNRKDSEKKSGLETTGNVSRQRETRSPFESGSTNDSRSTLRSVQPERRSSSVSDNVFGQSGNRNYDASENRSTQRSTVQPERRSSSGSDNAFGQSGNRNFDASENRSTQRSTVQPERRSSGSDNPFGQSGSRNNGADSRGPERSSVQTERSSSGSPDIQRSTSGGSENRSNGQKRGRE